MGWGIVKIFSVFILGTLSFLSGTGILIITQDDYSRKTKFIQGFKEINATILDSSIEDVSYRCGCVKAVCLPCSNYQVEILLGYTPTNHSKIEDTVYEKVPEDITQYTSAEVWAISNYPIGGNFTCYYNIEEPYSLYKDKEEFSRQKIESRMIASIFICLILGFTGMVAIFLSFMYLIVYCGNNCCRIRDEDCLYSVPV